MILFCGASIVSEFLDTVVTLYNRLHLQQLHLSSMVVAKAFEDLRKGRLQRLRYIVKRQAVQAPHVVQLPRTESRMGLPML